MLNTVLHLHHVMDSGLLFLVHNYNDDTDASNKARKIITNSPSNDTMVSTLTKLTGNIDFMNSPKMVSS